jgi:hypothetical protein
MFSPKSLALLTPLKLAGGGSIPGSTGKPVIDWSVPRVSRLTGGVVPGLFGLEVTTVGWTAPTAMGPTLFDPPTTGVTLGL